MSNEIGIKSNEISNEIGNETDEKQAQNTRTCVVCGNVTLHRYCSKACKQKSYRQKHQNHNLEGKNPGGTGAAPTEAPAQIKDNLDFTTEDILFLYAKTNTYLLNKSRPEHKRGKVTYTEFLFLLNMFGGVVKSEIVFFTFIDNLTTSNFWDELRDVNSFNDERMYELGKAYVRFEKMFFNRNLPKSK